MELKTNLNEQILYNSYLIFSNIINIAFNQDDNHNLMTVVTKENKTIIYSLSPSEYLLWQVTYNLYVDDVLRRQNDSTEG